MRVLVAEDEGRVADAVARGLRREGMAVDIARDGADALFKARLHRPDVLVLDRDLPEVHGDEVCRTVASELPEVRVLMLTGLAALEDTVGGLALGADDYMAKPFAFAELIARVRALARRAGPARPAVLAAAGVTLDPARRTVERDGNPIALSAKEFGVLEVLLGADGATVSNEELLGRIWDENADPFTNTVRMTVMKLRRKLGAPALIETVTGAGYRL